LSQASGAALLRVESVAHNFGGLKVLRNVTLDIPEGELVGLIGPNGSGKTTLFNIISGFLKPYGGRVLFDGRDITADDVAVRGHQGIVRTFQTPKVFERMTVLENVMVGNHRHTGTGFLQNLLLAPAVRREIREATEQAEEACGKFGLKDVMQVIAASLPAGMRRNLELARAYMSRPRCLLLDEPSSGLNSREIDLLAEWLMLLNREGMTILLVSHDMNLMGISSCVNVLYFGEIIASGSMERIQQDQLVQQAYLGM
jgi:branched-chain amino acid transport system ATP-binding protein/nonpolar-amino-acid-transporting ATPase